MASSNQWWLLPTTPGSSASQGYAQNINAYAQAMADKQKQRRQQIMAALQGNYKPDAETETNAGWNIPATQAQQPQAGANTATEAPEQQWMVKKTAGGWQAYPTTALNQLVPPGDQTEQQGQEPLYMQSTSGGRYGSTQQVQQQPQTKSFWQTLWENSATSDIAPAWQAVGQGVGDILNPQAKEERLAGLTPEAREQVDVPLWQRFINAQMATQMGLATPFLPKQAFNLLNVPVKALESTFSLPSAVVPDLNKAVQVYTKPFRGDISAPTKQELQAIQAPVQVMGEFQNWLGSDKTVKYQSDPSEYQSPLSSLINQVTTGKPTGAPVTYALGQAAGVGASGQAAMTKAGLRLLAGESPNAVKQGVSAPDASATQDQKDKFATQAQEAIESASLIARFNAQRNGVTTASELYKIGQDAADEMAATINALGMIPGEEEPIKELVFQLAASPIDPVSSIPLNKVAGIGALKPVGQALEKIGVEGGRVAKVGSTLIRASERVSNIPVVGRYLVHPEQAGAAEQARAKTKALDQTYNDAMKDALDASVRGISVKELQTNERMKTLAADATKASLSRAFARGYNKYINLRERLPESQAHVYTVLGEMSLSDLTNGVKSSDQMVQRLQAFVHNPESLIPELGNMPTTLRAEAARRVMEPALEGLTKLKSLQDPDGFNPIRFQLEAGRVLGAVSKEVAGVKPRDSAADKLFGGVRKLMGELYLRSPRQAARNAVSDYMTMAFDGLLNLDTTEQINDTLRRAGVADPSLIGEGMTSSPSMLSKVPGVGKWQNAMGDLNTRLENGRRKRAFYAGISKWTQTNWDPKLDALRQQWGPEFAPLFDTLEAGLRGTFTKQEMNNVLDVVLNAKSPAEQFYAEKYVRAAGLPVESLSPGYYTELSDTIRRMADDGASKEEIVALTQAEREKMRTDYYKRLSELGQTVRTRNTTQRDAEADVTERKAVYADMVKSMVDSGLFTPEQANTEIQNLFSEIDQGDTQLKTARAAIARRVTDLTTAEPTEEATQMSDLVRHAQEFEFQQRQYTRLAVDQENADVRIRLSKARSRDERQALAAQLWPEYKAKAQKWWNDANQTIMDRYYAVARALDAVKGHPELFADETAKLGGFEEMKGFADQMIEDTRASLQEGGRAGFDARLQTNRYRYDAARQGAWAQASATIKANPTLATDILDIMTRADQDVMQDASRTMGLKERALQQVLARNTSEAWDQYQDYADQIWRNHFDYAERRYNDHAIAQIGWEEVRQSPIASALKRLGYSEDQIYQWASDPSGESSKLMSAIITARVQAEDLPKLQEALAKARETAPGGATTPAPTPGGETTQPAASSSTEQALREQIARYQRERDEAQTVLATNPGPVAAREAQAKLDNAQQHLDAFEPQLAEITAASATPTPEPAASGTQTATEPVTEPAPAMTREQFRESLRTWGADGGQMTDEQADALMRVADARAYTWSKWTGRPPEEWYATRVADWTRGEGGTLFQEQPPARPVWYSQLQRTIEQKMPKRASVEQLRGIIKSSQIKPDELKWTGFNEWLSQQKGTVTKEDVLAHVQLPEMQEVTIGEPVQLQWTKFDGGEEAQGSPNQLTRPASYEIGYESNGKYKLYEINVPGARPTTFDSLEQARAAAQEAENSHAQHDSTRYSQYTLPGGENYREVLFTIPDMESPNPRAKEWQQGRGQSIEWHVTNSETDEEFTYEVAREGDGYELYRGSQDIGRFETALDAQNAAYEDAGIGFEGEAKPDFQSQHWKQPNVLAHTRLDDRYVDGQKVLFVEEIQSDWHQQGREKGYRSAENLTGIAEAPLSKTWHEMVFKRILRYAAENGYDKVAWTTGAQQSDRYNLSSQIDELRYARNNDGTYRVQGAKDSRPTFTDDRVPESKLAENFGQDVAQHMIAGEGDAAPKDSKYQMVLSDTNLSVGGEGMQGFYDKMLVDYANKYGKKWGARAEDIDIPSMDEANYVVTDQYGDDHGPYRSYDEARRVQGELNDPDAFIDTVAAADYRVHSMDVTDTMRESVMQGQPFFQEQATARRGSTQFIDDGRAIVRGMTAPDISTAIHEFGHILRRDLYQSLNEATDPAIRTQLQSDLKTMEVWAGVKDGKWSVDAEEHFARGFEEYTATGKAQNPALVRVFEKVKEWMAGIYASFRSVISGRMNDQVKGVFDRALSEYPALEAAPSAGVAPVAPTRPQMPTAEQMLPSTGATERPVATQPQAQTRQLPASAPNESTGATGPEAGQTQPPGPADEVLQEGLFAGIAPKQKPIEGAQMGLFGDEAATTRRGATQDILTEYNTVKRQVALETRPAQKAALQARLDNLKRQADARGIVVEPPADMGPMFGGAESEVSGPQREQVPESADEFIAANPGVEMPDLVAKAQGQIEAILAEDMANAMEQEARTMQGPSLSVIRAWIDTSDPALPPRRKVTLPNGHTVYDSAQPWTEMGPQRNGQRTTIDGDIREYMRQYGATPNDDQPGGELQSWLDYLRQSYRTGKEAQRGAGTTKRAQQDIADRLTKWTSVVDELKARTQQADVDAQALDAAQALVDALGDAEAAYQVIETWDDSEPIKPRALELVRQLRPQEATNEPNTTTATTGEPGAAGEPRSSGVQPNGAGTEDEIPAGAIATGQAETTGGVAGTERPTATTPTVTSAAGEPATPATGVTLSDTRASTGYKIVATSPDTWEVRRITGGAKVAHLATSLEEARAWLTEQKTNPDNVTVDDAGASQIVSTPKQPGNFTIREEDHPLKAGEKVYRVYREDGTPVNIGAESAQAAEQKLRESEPVASVKMEGGASNRREPWQMTRDEMVQSRIKEHEDAIAANEAKTKRIPGNLTRRKDRSDLRIAGEQGKLYQNSEMHRKRIDQLRSAEAQPEIDRLHRQIVEKALREGKPVPAEVLAEYPDLASNTLYQGQSPIASASFNRWFGNSKAVDADGHPQVMYHQTSTNAETRIYREGFKTSAPRARASDEQVPDGIFFKPDDRDIGIGASERGRTAQIPVYLSIQNPLVVDKRADIDGIVHDAQYSSLAKEARSTDIKYAREFDAMYARQAKNEISWDDFEAFYKDLKYRWTTDLNVTAAAARERLTTVLKERGYDGMIIEHDEGSVGRQTKTYIVLDSAQAKSATANEGTFDPTNPNILKQEQPTIPQEVLDAEARVERARNKLKELKRRARGMTQGERAAEGLGAKIQDAEKAAKAAGMRASALRREMGVASPAERAAVASNRAMPGAEGNPIPVRTTNVPQAEQPTTRQAPMDLPLPDGDIDTVDPETLARYRDAVAEAGNSDGIYHADLAHAAMQQQLRAIDAIIEGLQNDYDNFRPVESDEAQPAPTRARVTRGPRLEGISATSNAQAEQDALKAATMQAALKLPRGGAKQLRDEIEKLAGQQADMLSKGKVFAKSYSDFSLLDYGDKRGFDRWLFAVVPFSYWGTRQGRNYILRMMNNPGLLMAYLRYQEAMKKENQRRGSRQRFQGGINVGKLGGQWDVYVDPTSLIFPFAQLANVDWTDSQDAQNGMQKAYDLAGKFGFRPSPLWDVPIRMTNALVTPTGDAEKDAQQVATYGRGSVSDILGGFSAPIQGITAAAGIGGPTGVDIETPIRRALGIQEGEAWDAYRAARSVSDMAYEAQADAQSAGNQLDTAPYLAAQELISNHGKSGWMDMLNTMTAEQAAKELSVDQQTAALALQIVREGAKRATQQRGFQQLASYFTGVQAMQEPTGEQQRNQIMREQKAAAYSPYTGSGSKAQVNAVRNANPAYQVSQAQYGALPGESNDISYIYDTQKRQQVNDAYDALKDVLLQVQPWDKKLMSALEDSRATALSMVRDSDAAGQASDWTQEYKRFTATGEGASATTTIPYRPLSIAGATPDEALNIRKNEIMRYVSRTQPSAEDYMNDDGEIDFDAYNAAKKEWAKRLPSIALGLREVAQIGMQADKEGMGDELADYVMNLSQADVDTYRQRNDTPAEAAQRAYFDLVYNKTWDKYNQLVQAGTSKSDAYSRTVGAVGPLGTNELAQLVQRKYGDRWSAEELAQGIGNMTMPAMEQVRLGNLDTAGKAKVAAQQDFWDTYNNQIPPGKASYEIKQNPLVAIALDADTRGYATTQIYQAATALMRGWVVDNYGAADPEWAAARSAKKQLDMQITARYGRDGLNLLSQYEGLTDAAGKAMLRAQHPTLNNILMLRAQFATQNQLYRKYYGTGIGKR